MTAKKNIIGYINKEGYSDVTSRQIYEQDGKYFIVHVEKRVGDVKPEFVEGGFAAHCTNQADVWGAGIIVETSEPEEVFKNKKGEFYTTYNPHKEYMVSPDRLEAVKETIRSQRKGKYFEMVYQEDTFTLSVYSLTKFGERLTRKNIIGKPEPTCRYFYDYNF